MIPAARANGRRLIPFTIDGEAFTTSDISQRASALLRLAGLDPRTHSIWASLSDKDQPQPKRFDDDEISRSSGRTRSFVSIREKRSVRIMRPGRTSRFVDDMTALGLDHHSSRPGVVIYRITHRWMGPALATEVETGVSTEELDPMAPDASSLDITYPASYQLPADEQPAVAKVGMAYAQSRVHRLG